MARATRTRTPAATPQTPSRRTTRRAATAPPISRSSRSSTTERQVARRESQLLGDRIHGIQTRNSGEWHTGGLLIWNTDGLTLRGNTFDHNAIYDIEENASSTDSNLTIENNVFGWPVNPYDGGSSDGQETPKDWREIDLGGAATLSGALIRYNSFAHGALFRADGSFNNVQVIGNVLGSASVCAPTVSVDRNVFVGRSSCGTNVFRVSSWPYIDYKNNDFRLKPGSTAACFLANVRAGKPGRAPVSARREPRPAHADRSVRRRQTIVLRFRLATRYSQSVHSRGAQARTDEKGR